MAILLNQFFTILLETSKIIESHVFENKKQRLRIEEFARLVLRSIPSNKGIKKAIKRKQILINNRPSNSSYWMKYGDVLTVVFEQGQSTAKLNVDIPVIFEDDFLAIVNKPAGLPMHSNGRKNLVNLVPQLLKISNEMDALHKMYPVHRLDQATSGIVIVAKTKSAQIHLSKQFENRGVQKQYLAILQGKVELSGEINSLIEEKEAQSSYSRVEVFGNAIQNFSLVRLHPQTGRTHQLRIHTAEIGFPIVGDRIYGNIEKLITGRGLFLCAKSIQFKHPKTEEQLTFKIETPKKFIKFIRTKSRQSTSN